MPTDFPSALDAFAARKIVDLEDALQAVEALLGITGSTVAGTVEQRLTAVQTALASKADRSANLLDLADASAARTNLGLGSAATQNSSAFDSAGAASAAQAAAVQRANHTGTQAISTVNGLQAGLDAKADAAATTAALAGKQPTIPPGTYAGDKEMAALLDPLIVGAITRDANGAATSAAVVWPNGDSGAYTATTVSTAFPGAVDAYTVTKGSPVTATFTQPAVTRDANGAVTNRPAITVA